MDFRLLGPLEVFDGARAVAIGGGKRRSLLALLLLHGNKVVPADRLIDELWGEHPPPTAAKGLQVYISQLRRELAPKDPASNGHILVTRSNGYVLQVGPDEFDVQRFERSLDDGERALQAGEPERAAQRLRDGLALWRGPPLADFAYEQFAQHEIARLEELHLVAIEQRIDADLALGRHAQVVGELDALVSRYPMRERVRAQSMLALYRCGRQAEALESYRDARRTMTEQLGLEPGPALRDLEARILAQSPELAAPTTPRRSSRRETPAPTTPVALRTRRRAAALVIAGAAVILGVAALIAALRDEDNSTPRAVALDLAKDSLVALDPAGRGPEVAIPLPGRPTAVAAAGGRVFVATVDSATLTEVDGRTGKIVRIVAALQITPAAVAAAGNRVWVADRRRGLVVAFDVGYERQAARIPYPRARATGPAGLNVREPVAMATGGGAVWVTDGSPRLTRIDARSGAVSQATAGRTLDGVAGGAGAVWAFSARSATVVRVDPHTGAFTDRIRIATRRGTDKPYPIGIATTPGTVWVLNGNTATVTRIDAAQGGVRDTVPIGMDRLPRGIGTSGRTVWVANFDGSVSRIAPGRSTPSSVWVGDSLGAVVTAGGRVWVTTTALDQQLPGGKG